MKHLSSSLINSGIETLIKFDETYKGYSETDSAISENIQDAMNEDKLSVAYRPYLAVVEALFESGFVSTDVSCFNTDQLFNYIYGVKAVEQLENFTSAHNKLTEIQANDHIGSQQPSELYVTNSKKDGKQLSCFNCDSIYNIETKNKEDGCDHCTTFCNTKTYNSSGDNYFSAYSFKRKGTPDSEEKNNPVTRVLIIENQSPMYAIVVDEKTYSLTPKSMTIVRLKRKYNDPCRLKEFLKLVEEDMLKNNTKWSPFNDTISFGIITTVSIDDKSCDAVIEPKSIESALLNLESLAYCLDVDTDPMDSVN